MIGRIHVDELIVECVIGCLNTERRTPQRIRVDLHVDLEIDSAAASDRLSDTWNYADIVHEATFALQASRFYLLEAAGWTLLRQLLLPPLPSQTRPRVHAAQIALTKFGLLPGGARPRLQLQARADEQDFVRERKDWGSVDVIHETAHCGLYRLNVAPGQSIPDHFHATMREEELILDDGLVGWHNGGAPAPVQAGQTFKWKKQQPHGYRNESDRTASILCLDSPPFIPEDEVETGA